MDARNKGRKRPPKHGSQAEYKRGCRCADCRAWKAEDVARYRARCAEREGKEPRDVQGSKHAMAG